MSWVVQFRGTLPKQASSATMVKSGLKNRPAFCVLLAIMVAVVLSMTMHHSAMAAQPIALHHHMEQSDGNHCHKAKCQHGHSMPECCGMGLCLAAIPVGSVMCPAMHEQAQPQWVPQSMALWVYNRIDRPPIS